MGEPAEIDIDPGNSDQATEWNGDNGRYWAAHAERFEQANAHHHAPFMAAAAIAVTDRILDFGCGNGYTTCEAARTAVDGSVLGIDLSSPMLDVARRLADAEGLTNVEFLQADAQVHPFDHGSFDGAISRFGSMFFADRNAGFANLASAIRPGGSLTLLTWQSLERNDWMAELIALLRAGRDTPMPPAGTPGPFGLAEPDTIAEVLTGAGFEGVDIRPSIGPVWFGGDADDAYDFVTGLAGWMLDGLDDAARDQAMAALRESLEEHRTDGGVTYQSAAWITRARRR